ncbi:MAG: hypothetical protein NDJ89_09110 [Oligoflexia bacterium]|nr:hypothetical protein [Oligoflexia bacterium]
MELTYDWNCFQSMFYPKRRAPASAANANAGSEAAAPVFLVVEEERILSVFGEGEDFSSWIGAGYPQMAAEITHRELILFERKDVDRWMSGALALPHFHDQVEFLRQNAAPKVLSRGRLRKGGRTLLLRQGLEMPVYRHFILEAIQGWWAKVLPSSYGILIRLEGALPGTYVKDVLVVIRRGRVDSFCEPDFTILGRERSRQPEDVVRYLSEKHLVPVQGLFLPAELWQRWIEAENPWREVALAVRTDRAKLVPFRWSLVTLAATRGFLGI